MIPFKFSHMEWLSAPKSQKSNNDSQRKFQGTRKAMHTFQTIPFLDHQRSSAQVGGLEKGDTVHVHGGIFM
jgi:hypothetical protein